MSHYTVGVILRKENVDKLGLKEALAWAMAPFDENRRVPAYPANTIEELYTRLEKFRELSKKDKDDYYNLDYIKEQAKKGCFDSIEKFIKFEYGELEEDERTTPEGIPYTTYNPDSKWDWYVMGGRWSGLIKDGHCLVRNIPLKSEMSKEKIVDLKEYYDAITTESSDRTKKQEDLLKDDFFLYKSSYYREAHPTFEDYLDSKTSFSTYAILTSNGKWIEPGQMGWFGVSQSKPYDESHFYQVFADVIAKESGEDVFVVVDCHI